MKYYELVRQFAPLRKFSSAIIFIVLIVISLIYLESKRTSNSYYFDEVSWICNGRVWNELTHGRWNSQIWTEDYVQTRNPQLGKYLLGFWINEKYGEQGFQTFGCPGWGSLMWISGLEALTTQQREVIFWARIPMMVIGSFTVGMIYLIGRRLFTPLAGILAALFLLLSPLFQVSINRAMPDSPLLLLILITALLFIFAYGEHQHSIFNWHIRWSVLFGVLMGIAVSIKPYGLLLPLFLMTFWVNQLAIQITRTRQFHLKEGFVLGIHAFAVFLAFMIVAYVFNPTFWTSGKTFVNWVPNWFKVHSELARQNLLMGQGTILFKSPLYRILDMEEAFVYPAKYLSNLGIPLIHITLLVSGFAGLLKGWFVKNKFPESFLGIWLVGFLISSPLYIHFRFDRYYLPLLPPIILTEIVGGISLANQIFQLLKRLHHYR